MLFIECIKNFFCIKNRKKKEKKIAFVNPLYKKGFDINIYLKLIKITSNKINNNKCCICF